MHRPWHHIRVAFQGSRDTSSLTSSGYSTLSSTYASESSLSQKQLEVATSTLQSVPEDPRSSASVISQSLVSNVRTNFTYRFLRPGSVFWRLFIAEFCKKSAKSRQGWVTNTWGHVPDRNHKGTVYFNGFALVSFVILQVCVTWFGNKRSQKPGLENESKSANCDPSKLLQFLSYHGLKFRLNGCHHLSFDPQFSHQRRRPELVVINFSTPRHFHTISKKLEKKIINLLKLKLEVWICW